MTKAELRNLHEGDCIQSRLTGQNFLVTRNYSSHVTAVQTVDITHAEEWTLVYTVTPHMPRQGKP